MYTFEGGVWDDFLRLRSSAAQGLATVADQTMALTKRFSGKATAEMLEYDYGADDSGVHYQLENFELKVKAGKEDSVRWPVQGGWHCRWKVFLSSFCLPRSYLHKVLAFLTKSVLARSLLRVATTSVFMPTSLLIRTGSQFTLPLS